MPSILIIEDDAVIRETVGEFLEMEGYHVEEAANGLDALSNLRDASAVPCMIILDVMMPVMDGIEFRKRQLLDPRIARVPVVVMSGKGALDEVDEFKSLMIIYKPFKIDAVLHLAEEHCSDGSTPPR